METQRTATPKVVLSTIGTFHSFDLARQMHRLGALTAIFTGYPHFKLRKERLPPDMIRTFPWLHAPYMRLGGTFPAVKNFWERQDHVWFDRYVSKNLPACDTFCGLSGSGLLTGRLAKSRGAKYVCDRGSSHIRFQDRILREEYDAQGLPFRGIDGWVIDREEREYNEADAITVPSTFARRSFIECGTPVRKVQLVPYGVDLTKFYKTGDARGDEFRVVFVGSLSVRKGLPYLLRAFDRLEHPAKRLTLIGSVEQALRGVIDGIRMRRDISLLGQVPQSELRYHMSRSHVLVLPSVEDGFGMVLAQALACGCPAIASTNSGASDILSDGKEGFIVPIRQSDAIADRLQRMADDKNLQRTMSVAALERVDSIRGWDQYGELMYSVFQ